MKTTSLFAAIVCSVGIVFTCNHHVVAADLIKAPDEFVRYKLSNLRTEKEITGEVIAFDYIRTWEGKGNVRLAARSDNGPIQITGLFFRIQQSGTIRLTDRFANIRNVLNRGQGNTGVEFYCVAVDKYDFSDKQYLVWNSVRHGQLNTKLAARAMTKEEIDEAERLRKAKLPPEAVPDGYTRGTADTVLVPGAPVGMQRPSHGCYRNRLARVFTSRRSPPITRGR